MALRNTRPQSSTGPVGPPDYILDLGYTFYRSWIEKAAPGEAFKVLVYPASDPSAVRIEGTGSRTPNDESLIVSFTTHDEERGSYSLEYQALLHTISLLKMKPK
jgi:hypothetical protein